MLEAFFLILIVSRNRIVIQCKERKTSAISEGGCLGWSREHQQVYK